MGGAEAVVLIATPTAGAEVIVRASLAGVGVTAVLVTRVNSVKEDKTTGPTTTEEGATEFELDDTAVGFELAGASVEYSIVPPSQISV